MCGVHVGERHALEVDPDPDHLESLGDEIATLAAHIHAATHRLLTLIAEFDRLRGWEAGGYRSCAHWLAVRTGVDMGAAREKVRAARALVDLPGTSAAMSRGELSFSQVRALTRVADAENEEDLLAFAQGSTTAQIERLVRSWKRGNRLDEAAWEREKHASRMFSVFPDEEGMYLVKGRLDPEVAAVLMRAVEAASDALYRREVGEGGRPDREPDAARRRADAVGLLAERALAAGFGGGAAGAADEGDGSAAGAGVGAAATTGLEAMAPAPVSGSRAERYQVIVHVEESTLVSPEESGDASPNPSDADTGRSEFDDGQRVYPRFARMVSRAYNLPRFAPT